MLDDQGYILVKGQRKLDKTSLASRLKLREVKFFTDEELMQVQSGEVFFFDVECYPNFFYIAFKHAPTGKFVAFELSPEFSINIEKLNWMLWRFCIVGFNSRAYDVPMISLALTGANCEELKRASDIIIMGDGEKKITPWSFAKKYRLQIQNYNHIDLIEVAPLEGSLKLYGGRLHCDTMQDLPFEPDHHLTAEEGQILRIYCCNDLDNTEILFNELAGDIKLRMEMSETYGVDLRSKSDAQIAEAVINSELTKVLGKQPERPRYAEGTQLQYRIPGFISYETPQLQEILNVIERTSFELDKGGRPIMPTELEKMEVKLGKSTYNLGMGGLHSKESCVGYRADENTIIADNDVASYYPRIILNQGLFPDHLGEAFLEVYNTIVEKRLAAKKAKNKPVANSLKIVINGSFGKLGNKYSTLYSPQLMLQVTLTGQLALLMLIEMLERRGIACISGNTDGVISMYDKSRHEDVRATIAVWEELTNFQTEETQYSAVFSRDVNTYVAVKADGGDDDARFLDDRLGCKTKGAYCERGSALNSILSKNPEVLVCSDALISYLKNKTPVEETIRNCRDMRRFVTVKNVRGGGEKDGVYLGKVVRFYYPVGEKGSITYVKSGNKVANSEGARPLMDMPAEFPDDINYQWYIDKAVKMLYECGALKKAQTKSIFF